MKSFNLAKAAQLRCVEPQKRMVAGSYGWAVHRFPIKGGLPLSVILSDNLCRPTRLFGAFGAPKKKALV